MVLKYSLCAFIFSFGLLSLSSCGNITDTPSAPLHFFNENIAYVQGEININMDVPQVETDSTASPILMTLAGNINTDVCRTLAELAPRLENQCLSVQHEITTPDFLKQECIIWAKAYVAYGAETDTNNRPPTPYQLLSKWDAYSNKRIASVYIECTAFTGGAHGIFNALYLNYSRETGSVLDVFKLIQDTTVLMDLAKIEFCRQRSLPMNASKEQTTLFCELSQMPMPLNIGFSEKGLVLFYNPYEIAPWSSGPIKIEIPFSSLKDVFKTNFKLIN